MSKVLLVILDGFGLNPEEKENPLFHLETPILDHLVLAFPKTVLSASAESVGLGWGEVGNSEVGHSNLGTGQLVWQSAEEIDQMIKDGSFFKNKTLNTALEHVKNNHSSLHLVGLCSSGGIHSNLDHLLALLEMAKDKGVENVFVHAITDGRDTKPKKALNFLRQIDKKLEMFESAKISTIIGRFYAMDRDNNWQRTIAAYNLFIGRQKENVFRTVPEAVESSYRKNLSDENLEGSIIAENSLSSKQFIREDDAVIFFNYRADRARQLVKAFVKDDLSAEAKTIQRTKIHNLFFATMTPYETDWKVRVSVVFKPKLIARPLSEIISERGLLQFHTAETEKFAHVTYFFNGAREKEERGEKKVIIPSPKVKSYDVKPEMSLIPVVNNLVKELEGTGPDFVVINFANPDMVGHTGNFAASVKALYFVDRVLGQLLNIAKNFGYTTLVTADHGNVEQMRSPLSGEVDKEHTVNPVPFFRVEGFDIRKVKKLKTMEHKELWFNFSAGTQPGGVLGDVSTTIIDLLGIDKPEIYSGESLLPNLK